VAEIIVRMGLFDVTAKPDSIPSSFQKQTWVDLNQLKQDDLTVSKYATLEMNQTLLDGSFQEFPTAPQSNNMGYWGSSQSNALGVFETPQVLRFDFSKNHSSVGLTLDFQPYEDYASEMIVTWYDAAGATLDQKTYTPISNFFIIENVIQNYRKIIIQFTKTNIPNRWLKLKAVGFGIGRTWNSDMIKTASIIEEIDRLSSTASANKLDFRLYSPEQDFNIANPQGVYAMLQQTQKIQVTGITDGVEMNMGTFYLDKWQQENPNMSKFEALDILGLLDKSDFKDGEIYVNATAKSILDKIMLSANFSDYTIDTAIQNKLISGWLPICTHKEALQQLAVAAGAMIYTSRDDSIRVAPVSQANNKTINQDRKLSNQSKTTQKTFVSDVEIIAHNFIKSPTTSEVYKATLNTGTYEITLSEPHADYTISGGTITKTATNYIVINVTSQQEVTINGKKYEDQKASYLASVQNIPAGQSKNVVKSDKVTLITTTNAAEVAQRTLEYCQNRQIDEAAIILENETVGENAKLETLGGFYNNGMIERLEIDLTGSFRTKLKMTGKGE
jgi:hypothetical protein